MIAHAWRWRRKGSFAFDSLSQETCVFLYFHVWYFFSFALVSLLSPLFSFHLHSPFSSTFAIISFKSPNSLFHSPSRKTLGGGWFIYVIVFFFVLLSFITSAL
ncbi:hypothetical protein V8C35DRAFT_116722 [Trichoderma chlorosporum]